MSQPRIVQVNFQRTVEVPSVPNYLKAIDGEEKFNIAMLSESDLRKIGEQWTAALLDRATKLRGDRR